MQNAANALLDISTSASPSAKELAAMSCWMVMFHKRCENFQHVTMDTETMPATLSASLARGSYSGSRNLYGAEALRYRFERCKKAADGFQDEQDLKELRQFKWMLTDIELKASEEWTRAKVMSSKAKIVNRQKALRDVEKKVQEKKRLGDGADQSQLVVAPPLKRCALEIAVPVAKNEGDNEVAKNEGDNVDCAEITGVMSFFGAKAL